MCCMVLVEDVKNLERRREYYQKLMDENNQADIRKEQQVEVDDDFEEITSACV